MIKIQRLHSVPGLAADPSKKKTEEDLLVSRQYAQSQAAEHNLDTDESEVLQQRLQKLANNISRTYHPLMQDIDATRQNRLEPGEAHRDKTIEHDEIINNLYSGCSAADRAETLVLVQEIKQIQYFADSVNKNINSSSSEIAGKMIDQEISKYTQSSNLPPVIELILTRIWKQVMLNIYFDTDCGKTDWQQSKDFIGLMIRSVQSHRASADKRNLIKLIPVISREFKLGLQRLNCPEALQEKLLAHLRTHHLIALGKETS